MSKPASYIHGFTVLERIISILNTLMRLYFVRTNVFPLLSFQVSGVGRAALCKPREQLMMVHASHSGTPFK